MILLYFGEGGGLGKVACTLNMSEVLKDLLNLTSASAKNVVTANIMSLYCNCYKYLSL